MKRKEYIIPKIVVLKTQATCMETVSGEQTDGIIHSPDDEVDAEYAL